MIKNFRNYKFLTFIFVLFIFLSPRLNILGLPNTISSIRVEEITLLIFTIFFIFKILKLEIKIVDIFFFLFLSYILSSYLIGFLRGQPVTIYPFFRYCEFFLIYLFGRLFSDNYKVVLLCFFIIFYVNILVIILQFFNLMPAFRAQGIFEYASVRTYGLFGGPWELAIVFPMLAIILQKEAGIFKSLYINMLTSIIILFAGSRTAIISLPIMLKYKLNIISIIFLAILLVFFFYLMIILKVDTFMTYWGRIISLFGAENIYIIKEYWEGEYERIFFDWSNDFKKLRNYNFDISWSMRLSHWILAIKIYLHDYISIFFGVGTGVWGGSLDGGWLRILTANGLIGLFIFLSLIYNMIITKELLFIFLILGLNMIMIDAHLSIKAMGIFVFLSGMQVERIQS